MSVKLCSKLIWRNARCGRGREALRLYREMRGEGLLPDAATFLAALKACSAAPPPRDLQACREIHGHAAGSGHLAHVFVASALVDSYAKCGSIREAALVFEGMEQRDAVSWTALISGYACTRMPRLALDSFAAMQLEGFVPTPHTFASVLKALARLTSQPGHHSCLEQGRAIHAQIAHRGRAVESHTFVASALVDMYAKCGSITEARGAFEKMQCRDAVAWNSIIMGHAQTGMGHEALGLYARMRDEGVAPNARTFVAVLKACGSLAAQEKQGRVDGRPSLESRLLDRGRALHAELMQMGFESDVFVGSTLVDMYAKCGCIQDACRVFEKMRHKDVVAWNSMIVGYVQMGMGDLALKLYVRMHHEGLRPNARTYVGALKACSCMGAQEDVKGVDAELLKRSCLEQGRAVHSNLARLGLESNSFVANTLLDMYAKCGSMGDARWVFEGMSHRSVVSWTTMMVGYTQIEMADLALELYAQMQQEGFTPDAPAFVAAVKACSSLTSIEIGREIHSQVYRSGLMSELPIVNSLVDMYGKCGSMVDAQQLFDSLHARNSVTWTALIAGYSGQGNTKHVLDLYNKMQQEGIEPDATTFVSVLATCSHSGLVDKAQIHFQAMCIEHGISPNSKHYMCMVDLLGRAGKLDEAVSMLKHMPFKPDIIAWKSILGACRTWYFMDMGRIAFKSAMTLDERFSAAHSLMPNMYTSVHI